MAQSFLSQLGGAVNRGMENYRSQQATMPDEMTLKMMEVNPAFAQQYSQQRNMALQEREMQRQLAEQQRQKSSLAKIGEQWRTGGINPREALMELGLQTGDASLFAKGVQPTDMGATGAVVQQIMADNPGMGFTEALQLYQTGFRQNTRIDPETGQVVAAPGAADALGNLERGKSYGSGVGTLTARRELEPTVEADVVTAKSDAAYMAEGRQRLPQLQRSLQAKELNESFIQPKIESVMSRANEFTTGFGGAVGQALPGFPAFDLKADIDSLLANAGFDRLQEMRDNSPTGGALGQVTERELALLQAAAQTIYQSQTKEQLQRNLAAFQKQRQLSLQNVRDAYAQDYARFGGSADPNLPTPEQTIEKYSEPTKPRRYNPATGKIE